MNDEDLEREKTESFELGHISQLEDVADELRDRAGKMWANSSRNDTKTAKAYKKLAEEYEQRASDRRGRWEEKYD